LLRRLPRQKKHKRFVTLLEVLIAMGLISILLTVLLGVYGQTVKTQYQIEKTLQSNFQLLYAQFRLNQVIPTILNPRENKNKEYRGWAFYTQNPGSLVFTYDNGTGSGTYFSNDVTARLFVDENNRLMLLSWPVPKRYSDVEPPMRTEVLLENVDSLTFDFFKAKPSEKKRLQISHEKATGEFGDGFKTWSSDEEDIPAIIRIFVQLEGQKDPVLYAFLLSNTSIPVSYP